MKQQRRQATEQVIGALVRGLPPQSYQKNPYFPDLLHQPDLLIVPQLGTLIVVFLYHVRGPIGWGRALSWLEDLIEVKLNVGRHSLVYGIALAETEENTDAPRDDIGQLLRNTFDGFHFPSRWERGALRGILRERLLGTSLNPAFSDFLLGEQKLVSVESNRFDETKYKAMVEKESAPRIPLQQIENRIAQVIAESTGVQATSHRFFPNIKGVVGRLPRSYSFKFDIGIVGRQNVAIDVIQSRRYGSRERMRYLVAKGRLLRYGSDGGHLTFRPRDFRPILIVDGNISGPDHDPYRYVRALLSVGWEIARQDQVGQIRELIERGHF